MKRFLLALSFGLFIYLLNASVSNASLIFQDSFSGGVDSAHWIVSSDYYTTSSFGIKDASTQGKYTVMNTNNISYVNDNEIKLDTQISNNNPSAFNQSIPAKLCFADTL